MGELRLPKKGPLRINDKGVDGTLWGTRNQNVYFKLCDAQFRSRGNMDGFGI